MMEQKSRRTWKLWIAVAAIIGLGALVLHKAVNLLPISGHVMEAAIDEANVAVCQGNLSTLYANLLNYRSKKSAWPKESGVRFLAAPILEGVVPNDLVNAQRFSCPAVGHEAMNPRTLSWEDWWTDSTVINGTFSSYAGRDMKSFPLEKFDPREPLIACDNAHGPNHVDATNVLYADGAVQTLSLKDLIERGVLAGGATSIPVGPGSPVEDLRKLSLD